MARPFPYTFISCPCTDASIPATLAQHVPREHQHRKQVDASQTDHDNDTEDEEEERTFDPRSPRANFSLYPLEHLLYCEDCHQIKCPRCVTEEIVSYYCPSCLFETPSSMVKSEGNRCARNCFNCPICTAPLTVNTLENAESGGGTQQGPWILACAYCMWTTLEIGIKFDKPTNIRAQLAKLGPGPNHSNDRKTSRAYTDLKSPLSSIASPEDEFDEAPMYEREPAPSWDPQGPDARFKALKSFYQSQIAETSSSPVDPLIAADLGAAFSSPSTLNRIMSLYTNSSLGGLYSGPGKKSKSKPPLMREALSASEGLQIPVPHAENAVVQKMAAEDCGWEGLTSMEQRISQPSQPRFIDDLRPLPVLLRTKRSKRCKACKHILVKPEFKPQSTRFRIRLIALSYIPQPTIRPLIPGPHSSQSDTLPINLEALSPLRPAQFLLTMKNPMFDPIKVTLATPSVTPGRVTNRVTVLCPQFDVGANSDVWDEALQNNAPEVRQSRSEKVAEAGKVWDKGRNWTSVVLEVVPGTLPGSLPQGTLGGQLPLPGSQALLQAQQASGTHSAGAGEGAGTNASTNAGLTQDEDVVEIPVFVRIEWEGESGAEEPVHVRSEAPRKEKEPETVKRELAYWMVLGVGRIKAGGL